MAAEIILFHIRNLYGDKLLDWLVLDGYIILRHARRELQPKLLAEGNVFFLLCLLCIISKHLELRHLGVLCLLPVGHRIIP